MLKTSSRKPLVLLFDAPQGEAIAMLQSSWALACVHAICTWPHDSRGGGGLDCWGLEGKGFIHRGGQDEKLKLSPNSILCSGCVSWWSNRALPTERPSGSRGWPWGPALLAPKISPKSYSFKAILRGNPSILSKCWAQGPLGSKLRCPSDQNPGSALERK